MSIWDKYENRISASGRSQREAVLNREMNMLNRKLPSSLSFQTALVDGRPRKVAIIDSDNLDEKMIYTTEKKVIEGGELVTWEDQHWLVVECDAHQEVYTRAKLQQCNHLLKWIDKNGVIHQQWCIIEDGTKYLTGEYEDRNFAVTRGDTRIAMTIARNENTINLGRENRFLIDDVDAEQKLSYTLSKPLKLGSVYSRKGIYIFVLQEVVSTKYDNHKLGIADYYKYFPKYEDDKLETAGQPPQEVSDKEDTGKKVWL